MAESQVDLEQQCVTAFKQGNHDQAVQLLTQLQQPAGDVTTEFQIDNKSLPPNKDVTLLHLAAYHGWLDIIKTIKQCFPEHDCRDSNGLTPLHYAASSEHNTVAVIDYLIKTLDCDPNARTTNQNLPLIQFRPKGFPLNEDFCFGWCLYCKETGDQYFSSQFLHVLLLRLAYLFSSNTSTTHLEKNALSG